MPPRIVPESAVGALVTAIAAQLIRAELIESYLLGTQLTHRMEITLADRAMPLKAIHEVKIYLEIPDGPNGINHFGHATQGLQGGVTPRTAENPR